MAAMLIEIKSRMLLPRPPRADVEEDPRAELVRRLLEYERMKQAARRLDELPHAGRDFALVQVLFEQTAAARPPEVNVEDLRSAWLTLLGRAAANRHHRITRNQLSVREHMSRVLRTLQEARYVEFCELFDPAQGVAGPRRHAARAARAGARKPDRADPAGGVFPDLRQAEIRPSHCRSLIHS